MVNLAGEVVSIDGDVFAIPVDGHPRKVRSDEGLAFAISARGGTEHRLALSQGALTQQTLLALIDNLVAEHHEDANNVVAAVRLRGTFSHVLMRTVAPHETGEESLDDILAHETRFEFTGWAGTLVGFRFPDNHHANVDPSIEAVDGSVIAGLHLHGIAENFSSGGHVHEFELIVATEIDSELIITLDVLEAIPG
jgi:acetolactate decarboxylase